MSSPFGKAMVIANSAAGKGSVARDPAQLRELIASTGLEFDLELTKRPGHGADLASAAVVDGCGYVIAVGGDGTIHEVVNGMMNAVERGEAQNVLGILPMGSGSDFIRTFGLPRDPQEAVKHLAGDNTFDIDIGRITYSVGERTATRYFPNIAEAGLGGDVCRRAETLPRFLGGSRYKVAFFLTLGLSKASKGRIELDRRVYEGEIVNLVVANAQFFGGGMKIAPKAHPGDGKFDVLVQRGTKLDYLKGITKVGKGEHLPSPAIKEYHAATVTVTADPPLQIEADGEVLGMTPATFEIVPSALKLKV